MFAPLFGVLKAFKVLSLSFLFGIISYLSDRSHKHQIKSLILLKKEEILWLLFARIKEEKRWIQEMNKSAMAELKAGSWHPQNKCVDLGVS